MTEPIFINGQFRTRSTWWFTQFRKAPNTLCFYAPLTPILSDQTPEEAGFYSNSKSLRHEKTDHYYLEYPEFDKQLETARDWSQHPFVMGPNERDPEMKEHISRLIDHADKKRKVPVIKLNWGFLRGAWLKENFGGTHIYLDREYESLRRSFDSMQVYGWAWRDTVMNIGQNHDHPVIKPIADHLGYAPDKADYRAARKNAASFWATEHMNGNFDMQTRFEVAAYFQKLALHHAEKHYADIVIRNISDVKKTQQEIRDLTWVGVDISGYKHKDPAPKHKVEIDSVIRRGKRALDNLCC